MVEYKLKYFDARRRAEPIRMIFHYMKVPFEDIRISQADWPKEKENTPYGQVPVLYINGRPMAQAYAIMRYLGAKYGLAGKDDEERASLDEIMEVYRDMADQAKDYLVVLLGYGEGDLEKLRNEKFLPAANKYFPLMEQKLKESNSGFFGSSGPSYVDFFVNESIEVLKQPHYEQKLIEEIAPLLVEHSKRVNALPQLQDYLSKRNNTSF
ncbi:hypothetical protein M3Y94_00688000 [Aphelenchoides besseyi]|nr:hypothetical protein M3Y94_00688000 [Aphelenchoides besseyi]KAI6231496.1 Glutathione S-transferase-1 [Aphelenchoides besseyi]